MLFDFNSKIVCYSIKMRKDIIICIKHNIQEK